LLLFAEDVRAIEVSALAILFAELRGLEEIQGFEVRHVIRRVLWKLRHTDLRRELSDQIALERRVVDQHHRVEADVEAIDHAAEVVRFVVPVGNEAADIGLGQHHVAVLLKRLASLVLVVLAANPEDDPARAELLQPQLEVDVRFAVP
jgi:hypothetical protein